MNPKYIKFLAEHATGYEIINPDDEDMILRCPDEVEFYMVDFFEKEPVYHGDFLQKAIEGINRAHLNNDKYPTITIDAWDIEIRYKNPNIEDWGKGLDLWESIDEAKTAALEYVWKRESEQ